MKIKSITFILLVLLSITQFAKAQNASDTAIHVYETNDVKSTMLKSAEYGRLSRGTFSGYRIQINFGQDRNQANKVRSDFTLKYPGIPTYMAYQQPYFKVNVGDYRTKLEASKNLNIIRRSYPGSFIVKDKINPPSTAQQP